MSAIGTHMYAIRLKASATTRGHRAHQSPKANINSFGVSIAYGILHVSNVEQRHLTNTFPFFRAALSSLNSLILSVVDNLMQSYLISTTNDFSCSFFYHCCDIGHLSFWRTHTHTRARGRHVRMARDDCLRYTCAVSWLLNEQRNPTNHTLIAKIASPCRALMYRMPSPSIRKLGFSGRVHPSKQHRIGA